MSITISNRSFSENLLCSKALNQMRGLGNTMCQQVLDRLGISSSVTLQNIELIGTKRMNSLIQRHYEIDQQLLSRVQKDRKRLSSIGSYRGFRDFYALPRRGQRTHTNARTTRRLKGVDKLK